jgi:hypothetical protein
MLPRHRTHPSAPPAAGPQVQLHVRRVVLDDRQALGVPAADVPQALQQALAADLAGLQPAVNHVTPLHQLARSVGERVRPALAGSTGTAADGGPA